MSKVTETYGFTFPCANVLLYSQVTKAIKGHQCVTSPMIQHVDNKEARQHQLTASHTPGPSDSQELVGEGLTFLALPKTYLFLTP